jgi:heme exporter protein D
MNWSEFFNMGGYATFVWSSYGLTFAILFWNVVAPISRRKKIIAQVKRTIKREQLS